MPLQLCFAPEVLHVLPWPDDVMDNLGHDPRSTYVEEYWLGISARLRFGSCAASPPASSTALKASTSTWPRRPAPSGWATAAAGTRPSCAPSTGPSSSAWPNWWARTPFRSAGGSRPSTGRGCAASRLPCRPAMPPGRTNNCSSPRPSTSCAERANLPCRSLTWTRIMAPPNASCCGGAIRAQWRARRCSGQALRSARHF